MNIFAERLKELREEKNLTQAQVAEATQLSRAAIGLWENRQRTPNAEAVVILAKFFDVTADYLLGLEE